MPVKPKINFEASLNSVAADGEKIRRGAFAQAIEKVPAITLIDNLDALNIKPFDLDHRAEERWREQCLSNQLNGFSSCDGLRAIIKITASCDLVLLFQNLNCNSFFSSSAINFLLPLPS